MGYAISLLFLQWMHGIFLLENNKNRTIVWSKYTLQCIYVLMLLETCFWCVLSVSNVFDITKYNLPSQEVQFKLVKLSAYVQNTSECILMCILTLNDIDSKCACSTVARTVSVGVGDISEANVEEISWSMTPWGQRHYARIVSGSRLSPGDGCASLAGADSIGDVGDASDHWWHGINWNRELTISSIK